MNSKILLVKNIHIDKQYTNVLSYTEAQMLELCQDNLVAQADNYSFLRPTGSIMAGFTYAQCLQANYIAFQNPDYSNKWFFAWIDDVIYKGDKNTEITFTIDAWSTWFDYWQKKVCFIKRQHVNNDTIGLHTIPENIDAGEMILEEEEEILLYNDSNYYFILEGTYNPTTGKDFDGIGIYNGIASGSYLFAFKNYVNSPSFVATNINNFIKKINSDGKIESINNMYILPAWIIDNLGTTDNSYQGAIGSYTSYLINNSNDFIEIANTFNKTNSFKTYSPKNNKCFTYPYNYLIIDNHVGNYNILRYEDFSPENPSLVPQLVVQASLAVGGSVRLVPRAYKNIDYNYQESIPLAKFPTCSWSSDAFTNWLVSNAVNVGSSLVNLGAGIATGNVASVSGNIAGLIGNFYSANLQPNIEGGNNTGDIIFSSGKNTFSLYHMRSKNEYMKIIDDYFSRFGYKINNIETPNIVGRQYWNYVEIGDSEEIGYGEVPSKFMDIINNACRKGVTIWHNHANVGNYSLNNTIILKEGISLLLIYTKIKIN